MMTRSSLSKGVGARLNVAVIACLTVGLLEGVIVLGRWGHLMPGAWNHAVCLSVVVLCYAVLALAWLPVELCSFALVLVLTRALTREKGNPERTESWLWTLGVVLVPCVLFFLRPHHVAPILDFVAYIGARALGQDQSPFSQTTILLLLAPLIALAIHRPAAFFRRVLGMREGVSLQLRWAAGVLVALAAVATLWYQASHHENQHPYLHGSLIIATLVLMRWSIAAIGPRNLIVGAWRWGALLVLLLLSVVALHSILQGSSAVESRVMVNTDGARSIVFALRSRTDRDGDGFSPFFGGDDADDHSSDLHPGRLEIIGDGIDNDGSGGDLPVLGDSAQPTAHRGFTLPDPMRRVLCISVDALRPDVLDVAPNLKKLKSRSVAFTSARASGALTLTSYWSFVRAQTPRLFGRLDTQHLGTWLKDGGVESVAVLCDFFPDTLVFDRSYGRVSGDDLSPGPASTDATLEAWESLGDRGFCWVHYIDPHAPYEARAGTARSAPEWDRYLSEIRAADEEVGRLLEETGALENKGVAVIIFSDHGEAFGEHRGLYHGLSVYDEVLRTPLMLLVPGVAPREVKGSVSTVDLAPTILDLLHIAPPKRLRGRSLLHLALHGQDKNFDHTVAAANHMGLHCIISPDGRWKLIWDIPRATVEVYDLQEDPRETTNLADERPEKLREMREMRDRWLSSRSVQR